MHLDSVHHQMKAYICHFYQLLIYFKEYENILTS